MMWRWNTLNAMQQEKLIRVAFTASLENHVPEAKAHFVAGLNVRAKARTYLRSNDNGKNPFGDDNKKGNTTASPRTVF